MLHVFFANKALHIVMWGLASAHLFSIILDRGLRFGLGWIIVSIIVLWLFHRSATSLDPLPDQL